MSARRLRRDDADTLSCCSLSSRWCCPPTGCALATARSGTRSKNRPALPRTTSVATASGDHANPSTRRDVVGVGVDRLEELQIVAKAEIQCQPRADLPFVLCVDADVGIGL